MKQPALRADVAAQSFRDAVARLMDDVGELVARTVENGDEQRPPYAVVPRSAIEVSVRMNLETVRNSLLAGSPVVDDRDVEALTIRVDERLGQGLGVEDGIQGWRKSISVIQERFLEIATEQGVDAVASLNAVRVLWQLSDLMTNQMAALFRSRQLTGALRRSQLRAEFLEKVLAGGLPVSEVHARAEELGLDTTIDYLTVKAGTARGASVEALRRRLETRAGDLVVVADGYCFGLLSGPIGVLAPEDVVALGPAAPLPEVGASFELAKRIHDWMRRHGVRGRRRIEDIGWRLAVDRDEAVTSLLLRRYRAPLDSMGEFGALIWGSIRAYVNADKNVARAAEALVVHQNTLRYRLARFTEITGANLDSTDTLLEVAWALAADPDEAT
ncbi:PucR family transcriptional regulator [Amycolatopsis sp. MEPSY49]|uniref:PucR family transcriptional regulator n=1 Tax=Amycolatopsis sp. MEPSY49 TaxID=3151600 RepID=UPI003EF72E05